MQWKKQDTNCYHNRTLKYLETDLTIIMQEPYEEKYKSLFRELECDLSEPLIGKHSIIKRSIFLKLK